MLCLEEARGKYFKLLPQDDILQYNCLEQQIEVLDKDENQSIALVFCGRYIVNSSGKIILKRGYKGVQSGILPSKSVMRKCIRSGTNLIGEPGGVMFRKSIIYKAGRFDGSISYIIDLDYWFKLLKFGDAYFINQPLVSFRVSSGSWSVAIGKEQSSEFILFIDKLSHSQDYNMTNYDILSGKFMAKINNYLRLIFYKFISN